jgi:hypothetical protein
MRTEQERGSTLAQPKPEGCGTGRLRLGEWNEPEHESRAIGGGAA